MCRALAHLFTSVKLEVQSHHSPAEFLQCFDPARPGCIVVDVRLPGMSGLDLHARIRANHWSHPVVFLTGHADVETAVRAMKAGAVDFIQKPFNEQLLIETVSSAFFAHVELSKTEQRIARIRGRLDSLSPRERQVLDLVVAGKPTKQVSAELGLSHKTVDNHRASILDKMEARGVVELVRMALAARPDLLADPHHSDRPVTAPRLSKVS